MASLTIITDDSLSKILLPDHTNLGSAGLGWSRGPSSKGRNGSTRRHDNDSTEVEIETNIWPLWGPHMPLNTQINKGLL